MDEQEIKERLLKENKEFREAFEQHRKLENRLFKFQSKSYLTDEEKLKEKQLKKEKLILKDKMYHLMTEFRRLVK